jgi:acyl carrier protein
VNIQTFVEKFADAIEVSPQTLSADTEYKNLDVWDSLNTLAVIAMSDADFNVALSGQDVESSRTVGDLWKVIESKMKAS